MILVAGIHVGICIYYYGRLLLGFLQLLIQTRRKDPWRVNSSRATIMSTTVLSESNSGAWFQFTIALHLGQVRIRGTHGGSKHELEQ